MRKPKPTSADQIEQWAIQCVEQLLSVSDSTDVKIATAYLRGYADCMEAMNDEHWAEVQAKMRAMFGEPPHPQHSEQQP